MTRTLPALLLLAMTTAPALADDAKPIYRLDFEVMTTESGKPVSSKLFSLALPEDRVGEVRMGDNVTLPTGTGTTRQDVGVRVNASFVSHGSALLLNVDTELTERAGASSLHRIETKGFALATPGKKTMVSSVDSDKTHTELSVTPTKL